MKPWLPALAVIALCGFALFAKTKLGEQLDGSFLVSSGQRIELLGQTTRLEGLRPKDMALSPDGKTVALLTHARLILSDVVGVGKADAKISPGPLGIAWSPDGSQVYCSLSSGKIQVFAWDGTILSPSKAIFATPMEVRGNPGLGGLAVAADGTIYAALSIRNEVAAISPDGKILNTWKVGAAPYHLKLSPDGHTLAIANRGGTVIEPRPEQGDPSTRTAFQGTGVASAASAGTEVQIDPRTDSALVGTVSLIHLDRPGSEVKNVTVGRQPSGMVFSADGKRLYVADSDEDALSIVDTSTQTETAKISLSPAEDPSFGQIPTALSLSPDGKRIYVALGGANAIAVLENGPKPKVTGYFPTAWYPISIEATADHVLVGCAKGIGSRPSSKKTGFGVHDSVGVYQAFTLKDIQDLRGLTRRVAKNNDWTKIQSPRANVAAVPVPERIGEPSVFKHVVYIVKENLSYDALMGDNPAGDGDPSLCTFPENVSPNHHALAKRFGLLDNFYISGTNSADGHQWVDSAIANGYSEQNYSANQRSYPYDGGDPLAFSPAGFLWSQAKAAGKTVRVFGEFVDKPSVVDTVTGKGASWRRCWEDYKSGKNEVAIKAITSQAALRDSLDPIYIGFPSSVSDQWRADRFLDQFKQWTTNDGMPNLTIMLLPNDHTVGTRPGWPTPRADVADNDLALGRIVEAISHSKFWADTLIIVTEDDSQNGLDHVDGHRSLCFCISPYSRPDTTISEMYNHATVAATIGRVLGFQPMTRFDRTAKPMTGCFGDKPDLTPFVVVPNRVPLDEVSPAPKQLQNLEARRLAEACAKMDWSEVDNQDQDTVNRAIWQSEAARTVGREGYSIRYPGPETAPRSKASIKRDVDGD